MHRALILLLAVLFVVPAFAAETSQPGQLAVGDTFVVEPDAFTADEAAGGYTEGVSVRDMGAVGDGTTDDTTAFESAITAAKSKGQPVMVPEGSYRITRTLTIKSQALIGLRGGAWNADSCPLPKIIVGFSTGPCIKLEGGGSVIGLQFSTDWGGQSPSFRPPTIRLSGVGCRVSEVKIANAWDAIMADGVNNVGRSIIEKCFILNVHNIGVRMLGSWDCSWISKVEVWSPSSSTFSTAGIGFLLGKNDMLVMSDCFVFKAHVGFHFVNEIPGTAIVGSSWGTLSNCSVDFSSFGLKIEGGATLSIVGGTYWTHFGAMSVKGSAKVNVSGSELRANGGPALTIEGGETVAISGAHIRRQASEFTEPAVKITGGGGTVIAGCIISSSSNGVEISPGVQNVVVTANLVRENL